MQARVDQPEPGVAERGELQLELAREPHVVRVQESQVVTGRGRCTRVARRRDASPPVEITVTGAPNSAATRAVSSVDPSSTTMHSCTGAVWASTLAIASRIQRPAFLAG